GPSLETKARIIVIDDMPAIQADFRTILAGGTDEQRELDRLERELLGEAVDEVGSVDFQLDAASQGQEGLERVRAARDEDRPYALAFVDIRMPPGWDGIETIEHL